MLQVIQWFIASCSVCDKAKVPHTFPTGKLIPVQIPQRPWSYIAIDFLTNLPPSQNKTVIMMIVERFSKTLCLDFPLPILPSDFEMAEIVLEHVFNTLSSPEDIVSDRGFSWHPEYAKLSKGQKERAKLEIGSFYGHSGGLGTIPPKGWVLPKLPEAFRNKPHTLPMCPGLPAASVPMEHQTYWLTHRSQLVPADESSYRNKPTNI